MKICPTCKKTYTDESLNFCLEDGAVLNQFNEDDNSQATVFLPQPPTTIPNAQVVNPTAANQTAANQTFPPQNRGLSNTVPPQAPVKKSKAWVWVLGIILVIGVVGGLGFIGIVALIATNIDDSDNSKTNGNKTIPGDKSPTPVVFKNILKDDFAKWQVETNDYGKTEYRGGEYIVSAKQANYYYVLISLNKTFTTADAATKVTLRNVNGTATNLGYGLLVNCDQDTPLDKDYGFLIDSTKQSYRVVQHTAKKETTLVNWTRFPAIRSGTQTNEMEVRDQSGKLSLYINGQFATSVDATTNAATGVFGIYSGDAIPVAFSNLQIGK